MIEDFYTKLSYRIDRLSRYKANPYKLAFKLAFWVLRSAITPSFLEKNNRYKGHDTKIIHSMNPNPRIAIQLKGGVGDIVLGGLYARSLYLRFPELLMTISLGESQLKLANCLFKSHTFYSKLVRDIDLKYEDYDIVIELDVYFPKIIYKNNYTKFENRDINKYLQALEKFHQQFPTITRTDRVPDQMLLMLATGLNRITCMDIDGVIGLSTSSKFPINLDLDNEQRLLEKFPFLKEKYITIGRGVDKNNDWHDSTRLWSVDKYNRWIKLFKQKYPSVKVVQLGVSKDRCEKLDVDIDLVGLTTFEELLIILKRATIHLDGECGYVHLRHFLTEGKGKSIVIFGPTSNVIRGYPENINIRNDNSCELPLCEWIAGGSWQSFCLKTKECRAHCVESVSPEFVHQESQKLLDIIFSDVK